MTSTPLPSMPARRIGALERPGCRLHYEVTGAGPAIIFLHGLGGNHLSWWQQVAHFSPGHSCVALSARGFAPSSAVAGGPDPGDFAGDLAALIGQLKLENPVLVAQSMGGWGALDYALAHKGGVRALVLAATTGTIDPMRIEGPEQARLAAWQERSSHAAHDNAERRIHVACGARMAAEQPALHLLYRHIDDMNQGLDKTLLRERLGRARVRAPGELAGAGCPVLFISGDEDIVIPPFAADAIARAAPDAKTVHIPDAGHSAYFERAARFNQIVGDFLTA